MDQTKLQESHIDNGTMGAVMRRAAKGRPALPRPKAPVSAPNEPAPGYGSLFEPNQQVFAGWFRGIGAVSGEVTRFIQDRWSEDMAAWSALAHCRTPEEAFDCQRRFVEKAMTQYAEEIAKLSQLMLTLTTHDVRSIAESKPVREAPGDAPTQRGVSAAAPPSPIDERPP